MTTNGSRERSRCSLLRGSAHESKRQRLQLDWAEGAGHRLRAPHRVDPKAAHAPDEGPPERHRHRRATERPPTQQSGAPEPGRHAGVGRSNSSRMWARNSISCAGTMAGSPVARPSKRLPSMTAEIRPAVAGDVEAPGGAPAAVSATPGGSLRSRNRAPDRRARSRVAPGWRYRAENRRLVHRNVVHRPSMPVTA